MSITADHRRQQVIELLLNNPHGLSPSEISEMVGVSRQTITTYLKELETEGVSKVEGTYRYTIDGREHFRPMHLSLPHVWLLYLQFRRVVRANLHKDSQYSTLLRRLATLLHEEIADHLVPQDTEQVSHRSRLFADLVYAWHDEKYVEIQYQALHRKGMLRHVIAPWWFEASVWSDSLYLIGGVHGKTTDDEPMMLKLERIQSVRMTNDSFTRPDPQDILNYLKSTWGIWVGGTEPVEVVLRFHHRQKQRLLETHWHPDQEIIDDGEYIFWKARIAEPREMLPWIRGWGADVEVMEPQPLRDEMIGEARALARLYGVDNPDTDMFDDIFGG